MSAGTRCKNIFCAEREPSRKGRAKVWWDDYGCCSRACTTTYYGPEVLP